MTLLALLAACATPEPLEVATEPPRVSVEVRSSTRLEAVLPTDVLPRRDGELWVLDGYAGRVIRVGADGTLLGELPLGSGRPVRLAAAEDGGAWAVDPGGDGDAPALLHLGRDGAVDRLLPFAPPDEPDAAPVAAVDTGAELVVADRAGHLHWIDATTGEARRRVDLTTGDTPLTFAADLGRDGDGLYVVDPLGARVARLAADGSPRSGFGRFGVWAGRLFQPKAAAPVGEGWLVVDSALGAVQAFDREGELVGLLGDGAEVLRVGHPIAVRALPGSADTFAVLDARPARLDVVRLSGPLPAAPDTPFLRYALLDPRKDPGGVQGEGCVGCHDGLVRDDREAWDPARAHHPVGVKPERALPSFFPLDDEGKIACTTCHSPHGVVDADDARAQDASARPVLVRHASEGDPFLRLTGGDDALCVACHEGVGHVGAAGRMEGTGDGHPTGSALLAALERRGGDAEEALAGTCLGCHAPHGATGPSLTRSPVDGKLCVGCHTDKGVGARNHPLGRSVGADVPPARASAHLTLARDGGPACLTCHDLVEGGGRALLRSPEDGGVLCLACHSDRQAVAEGPHAVVGPRGGPACLGCHDPHGADREAHLLTTVAGARAGDPSGCTTCHGPDHAVAPGVAGHPVDGRALADGSALTCQSCHDPHGPAPARLAGGTAQGPSTCLACHSEQAHAKEAGGHGSAQCLDCHPAHEPVALARGETNPASRRCLACHAPGAGGDAPRVAAWEHPAPMFTPDGARWTPLAGLPLFSEAGVEVPAGQNGDLTCQSCHVVHGPDTKAEGGTTDHLRRATGWQEACASCHGADALVLYRYVHRPDRRKEAP